MIVAGAVMMIGVMIVGMIMNVVGVGADALGVVVVARLGETDLVLEAEDLFAVLAHLAVHHVGAGDDLLDAVEEGIDDQGMIIEVGRLDEFDIGMTKRDPVGRVVNPLDQHTGEQEVGEHDDAAVAEPRRVLESRLDQGKGDT